MKNLFLLIILLFVLSSCSESDVIKTDFSSPTFIGGDTEGNKLYMDYETIKKEADYVYWTSMIVFREPITLEKSDGYLSVHSYHKGNCKNFRAKTLEERYYKNSKGTGNPKTSSLSLYGKMWFRPPPGSPLEAVLKISCN